MAYLFKISKYLMAVFLGLHAAFALAHGFKLGDIKIEHPYAAPVGEGVKNGAVYIRGLRNDGKVADQLIGASSAMASKIEFHSMKMQGNVMKMRQVSAVDLTPGETVELAHGADRSYHLMLIGLTRPLKEGERFPVTLTFQKAGSVDVIVVVQRTPMFHHGH